MSNENKHFLKDGAVVLYTRNGSSTYHVRIKVPRVNGYIVKSTGCRDLHEAIQFATNLYEDLRYKERHNLEVRAHTFQSVYLKWLSEYKNQLSVHRRKFVEGTARRYFLPFLGRVDELTQV